MNNGVNKGMKKIGIKICMGTACYVMGSGSFVFLKEHLDAKTAALVEIEAVSCCDLCSGSDPEPPYVQINEQCIANASIEVIVQRIETLIEEYRETADDEE